MYVWCSSEYDLTVVHVMQGNRTCDICKTVVKNLPEVPPQLPDSATTQNGFDENGEMLRNNALILSEQTPSGADVVFDCIRVCLQPELCLLNS